MVLPKLPGYRAGRGDLPVMAGGAEGNGGQQQVGDGRGEPAGQPGDVRAAEGPDERADIVRLGHERPFGGEPRRVGEQPAPGEPAVDAVGGEERRDIVTAAADQEVVGQIDRGPGDQDDQRTSRKLVMLVTSDRYPRHAVTTPAAITHTKGTSRTAIDSALNRRHMPPNARI